MSPKIKRVLLDTADVLENAEKATLQTAIERYFNGVPIPDSDLIVLDVDGKIYRAVLSAEFEQISQEDAIERLSNEDIEQRDIALALELVSEDEEDPEVIDAALGHP